MSVREQYGWCALCRSRCGTINTIDGDRLIKVSPNPDHPTGRAVCPKGRAAPEITHSTRRLLRPLKRTRPKGDPDPGWRAVSWDEALTDIAIRLQGIKEESGAEAVAFALSSPSGTALSDGFDWILRFVRLFGSPNICDAMEICNWQKDHAHKFTFGHAMGTPDYARSDLILLWGFNPANSWLSLSGAVANAQARGAKVAVIDPRRAGHALRTPYWFGLRPGTDGVLALGIAHRLIALDAYDRDFVRRWTNAPLLVDTRTGEFLRGRHLGFRDFPDCFVVWIAGEGRVAAYHPDRALSSDEGQRFALRGEFRIVTANGTFDCQPAFEIYARACAPYDIGHVADVTGLRPSEIETLADLIANAQAISYHAWTGIAQHAQATQTERAIALLYALTGRVDAEGGNLWLNRQPVNPVGDPSLLDEAQRRKALGFSERPLGPPELGEVTASDVYTAIIEKRPYPVRALVALGSNILASRPEPQRAQQALGVLEFHVHVDMFMTPSAAMADYVLPANSPWEREALRVGFEITADAEELVQLRAPMVPSQGESRSDLWIVFELAKRLGMASAFHDGDIEAAWNHTLSPLGLTVDDLRATPEGIRRPVAQRHRKYADVTDGRVTGFPTRTRRVEIYSEPLHHAGYPPVPVFTPHDASSTPDAETRYPYILTNARLGNFCHGQHRSIASLRRRAPEPIVHVGTDVAREHRLDEGDWADLVTATGTATFKVAVDPDLRPGVVVADYGWWEANHDLALPGFDILGPGSSNFNLLTPTNTWDPVSGAVPLRSTRCTIAPNRERSAREGRALSTDCRVSGITRETDDTVSVSLTPMTRENLPDFVPGQHVTVECAIAGKSPRRAYSLSNAATGRRTGDGYRITVKRARREATPGGPVHPGLVSTHINTALALGDRVRVQGPAGWFRLPDKPDFPVVMIAAGVGITPFMSYLETIAPRSDQPEGALYYGSRNGAAHIFKDRLRELRPRLRGMEIVEYLSRPSADDQLGVDYDREGHVDAADIARSWIDRRARFYLCGPVTMLRAVTDGLIARGVPSFEIFSEAFHAPPVVPPPDTGTAHRVHFARSQRTATWTAEVGTVMDLAERLGVALSAGCRMGQCESCSVRIVSGTVAHRVGEDRLAEDDCLTCQAVPTSDLTLDA